MMNQIELPNAVVLELNYECNHSCLFCSCPWASKESQYKIGKFLTLEQWKQAIDILIGNGIDFFSISGGEPLMNPDLIEILNYIYQKNNPKGSGNSITLISNGLLLNEKILEEFKKLNINLCISIPGIKSFKKHTGIDNVAGVLKWLSIAHKLEIPTTANITITKLNYNEIFETVSYTIINGADTILLNRFLPGGRGLDNINTLSLSKQELEFALDSAETALSLSNRNGMVGTEMPLCSMPFIEKYPHISIGSQCAAVKLFFVVGPSGEIRVCNHSPRIVGNIFEKEMIVDKFYWLDYQNSNFKPEECNKCGLKNKCDAGCREVAEILNGSHRHLDSTLGINEVL